MWATDRFGALLTDFDWNGLRTDLLPRSQDWTDMVIAHAQKEGVFFPDPRSFDDSDELEPQ